MASSNQPKLKMLTKNFSQLKSEVRLHIEADFVAQGSYRTCFIGCLANHTDNPWYIENTYGIPEMVSRIAESIFEGLPSDEAPAFFDALPAAVACDGKDLSRIPWQFLAKELNETKSLLAVEDEIHAVIDRVIAGMNLLAEGKEWPEGVASAAARDADAAARAASAAARDADAAAWAASAAANATDWAASAANRDADAAAWAASAAANAASDAASAASAAVSEVASAAVRRRQRDLLLKLIKEAPVVSAEGE